MELMEPRVYVTNFDIPSSIKIIENLTKIMSVYGGEQPIVIDINSYGGEVAGLSQIYNKIISMPNPIITYCSGMALSAGCFLFTNCAKPKNRIIAPAAKLMLHEVQSGTWGDVKDIVADTEFTKELSKTWMEITAKSIGLESYEDIKEFMRSKTESHNLFMNSKEAIEYGFAGMIGNVQLSSPAITCEVIVVPPEVEEPKVIIEEKKKVVKRKKKK